MRDGRALPAIPTATSPHGDGVSLTPVLGSTAFFDFEGDGFAVRTGWVAPTDGLLAIDTNGNGRIDNYTELFGNDTQDGFAARMQVGIRSAKKTVLAGLDSNADGVINASDTAWSALRLWVDANGDGTTDAGELHALADYDIASFSLATTATPGLEIAGNSVPAVSTFTRGDGSIRNSSRRTYF